MRLRSSLYKVELARTIEQSGVLILTAGGGKKKKSKSDDAARQDECQMWVEKHRDHIQKLETLLR